MRLISLTEAQRHCRTDDSEDPALEVALEGALALTESLLDRPLVAPDAPVTDRVDGLGSEVVYLPTWPLVELVSVAISEARADVDTWTLDDPPMAWRGRGVVADTGTPALADIDPEGHGGLARLDGGVWPRGTRNVTVVHRSGYTPATFPPDLRLLVLQLTKAILSRQGKEGLRSETFDTYSADYSQSAAELLASIPGASATIDRHRRVA